MIKKWLLLLLLGLSIEGYSQSFLRDFEQDAHGGIIRSNRTDRRISLLFTGHEFADGARTILRTLKKEKVRGYFFFTGDFLRRFPRVVRTIHNEGHYIGPHSDKHLLYCDWDKRDSLLLTKELFLSDLTANYRILEEMGVPKEEPLWFVAPYEWYNTTIVGWCKEMGVQLINFTPGTGTNADYTYPDMPNYRSSAVLLERLLEAERIHPNGLSGAHLLVHIGVDPRRKDVFYAYLGRLMRILSEKGYQF